MALPCIRTLIWAALTVIGQADDVAFADRALLEVNEPLPEAVDVQNVVAHRNFHHLFFLFEVLKTESALLLISHVCEFCIRFVSCVDRSELYSVHNVEVNADDCLCVFGAFIVVESSIATANLLVASHVSITLFVLGHEEAANFNQYDEQEGKDGPWYQDHYHSVS